MKRPLFAIGVFAILATATTGAWAADHIDSPAAVADPASDITDVYTWMEPDASKVNLVMNVTPLAEMSASFSTAVIYKFNLVNTQTNPPPVFHELVCKFYDATNIECWLQSAGTVADYVTGDPSNTAGIASDSGAVRVFAGLRNDPFFFNLAGFNATIDAIKTAAGGLTFNGEGCPTNVDASTSSTLVGLLGATNGGAAVDFFAGENVLSLVVQLDKALVSSTANPRLLVWASTHAAN